MRRRVTFLPYMSLTTKDEDDGEERFYCPKCGSFIPEQTYVICKRRWVRWKCPDGDVEHFHCSCPGCKAEWCETTYDATPDGIRDIVTPVVEMALEAGMTEEDLLRIMREKVVRDVSES